MKTQLDEMARTMVGDGKRPNLYFVSKQVTKDKSEVQLVTRDFEQAYEAWKHLRFNHAGESCLEDRQWGVIASREPDEDGSARLITTDDSPEIRRKLKGRKAA